MLTFSFSFFFLNTSKSLIKQNILFSKETAAMVSDLENTRPGISMESLIARTVSLLKISTFKWFWVWVFFQTKDSRFSCPCLSPDPYTAMICKRASEYSVL